jgi:hypothetical protein
MMIRPGGIPEFKRFLAISAAKLLRRLLHRPSLRLLAATIFW